MTPNQSSSDWDEAIEGFLQGFHGPSTPSPAVLEGEDLPEISGIARLGNYSDDDEDANEDDGYDGDDEAD